MKATLSLTLAQLRMYARDRQAVFLAFFFPLVLMVAFGFMATGGVDPVDIAVSAEDGGMPSGPILDALDGNDLLNVSQLNEQQAAAALKKGTVTLVLMVPGGTVSASDPTPVHALVNAGNPQGTQRALALVRSALTGLEYKIRGTAPMFAVDTEDVLNRQLRYIDFLVPGILAFMVMQLSVAGSGFNVVEYKRKGILKRLFVTPLTPINFVGALIASRMIVILGQLAIILLAAILMFQTRIVGSLPLLVAFIIAGGVLFLSIGFALGGLAKTQNSVVLFGNLFIFPQTFLASVFFPLDALPSWLRAFGHVLPLTFVADAIRRIANDGAGLSALGADIAGIAAWTVVGLILAVYLFRWSDSTDA